MRPQIAVMTLLAGFVLFVRMAVSQESSFVVGVFIYPDEKEWNLLPVAHFEGGRWINTWPEPVDEDKPVVADAGGC